MRLRVIILLLAVVLVALGGWLLLDYLTIDRCLDDGGRWNYSSGACEHG